MNLLVPSVPRALRITQTMWNDFLCDPVLAAEIIFGIKLDAFQKARLRYYWWVSNVIDSSGVSSGKTICVFLFLVLRCILLPDHEGAVYYPVFDTGKNSFWDYFGKFHQPMFRAQLGQPLKLEPGEMVDGDGTSHGAGCYKAYFRNGNKLLMPAPSFMKDAQTQASLRLNTLVVEEWSHVDASSDGIDKQLIDRTSRPCWNQYHPIWGNHILFSGHARTRMHPAWSRYNSHQRQVDAGDPTYANPSYSYKDYSTLPCHTGKTFQQQYRVEGTIRAKRAVTKQKTDWLTQGLGIWAIDGDGWFTEASVLQCIANGKARGVTPITSRAQYELTVPG